MIKSWINLGHEVVCSSIEPKEEVADQIGQLGASYYQISGTRTGKSVFEGFSMIKQYRRMFKEINPDKTFLYMSKPIAYGGLAAMKERISNVFVFVTGMEIAFYSPGLVNWFVKNLLTVWYRKVHSYCQKVFFMSHFDEKYMLEHNMVKKEQVVYVDGTGVNMDWFKRTPLPETPVFLMIGRLVWSKGIREYIEAAKIVHSTHPEVPFLLLGPMDENDEALSKEELTTIESAGIIRYLGETKDVRPFIEQCSILVLPSYHEGKGRVLLEAQSMGRPVIASNAPGCSETVVEGYNGFLATVKDGKDLADKMLKYVEKPEIIAIMGENAYEHCKKTFDVRIINATINREMGLC
jgi:glycosyltransferase involved in cell wall biosynthesis